MADNLSNRFVKSEWVDLALNVMAEGLERTTGASGQAKWAEHEARKTKAKLMLSEHNPEKSAAMREQWAVCQPEYDRAYKKYCDAHAAEIDGKDQSRKAESIISAWQTEERIIARAEQMR